MQEPIPRVRLIDSPVDAVTMEQVIELCLGWIRGDRRPRQILTTNVALIVAIRSDSKLNQVVESAELVVADGVPILWTSRLLHAALPGRVAGVDLMARLLKRGDQEKLRVFFLGAHQEVVTALVEQTKQKYPQLVITGYRNGYFNQQKWPEIIQQIRDSQADILFVGMPSPFKETWCFDHLQALGTPIVLGVGGSFDVLAGFTRRAPLWMQNAGLEWFWRLLMEPRKMWKRYLTTNTVFLTLLMREMLVSRFRKSSRGR